MFSNLLLIWPKNIGNLRSIYFPRAEPQKLLHFSNMNAMNQWKSQVLEKIHILWEIFNLVKTILIRITWPFMISWNYSLNLKNVRNSSKFRSFGLETMKIGISDKFLDLFKKLSIENWFEVILTDFMGKFFIVFYNARKWHYFIQQCIRSMGSDPHADVIEFLCFPYKKGQHYSIF